MHPRVKIKTRTTPQKRLGNLWKRFFPCFHRLSYINFWKTDIAVENCSFILRLWVCNFPIKFCDFSTVILCYTPLLEGMIYIYNIYIFREIPSLQLQCHCGRPRFRSSPFGAALEKGLGALGGELRAGAKARNDLIQRPRLGESTSKI